VEGALTVWLLEGVAVFSGPLVRVVVLAAANSATVKSANSVNPKINLESVFLCSSMNFKFS